MAWTIRKVGWGVALAVSSNLAWADEPALVREPKPLTGAAVEPTLVPPGDHEVIRERYPNRNVKIERHVAQDAEGNFVNHGSWKMWDEQGRAMGGGEYVQGQRQGTWTRHFLAGEAELVSGPLAKQFSGPFVSTAVFDHGKLHGQWTVVDAKDRTVFDWSFKNDKRHGRCVWYYPNGEPWREVHYVDGEPNGEFSEWAPDGQIIAEEKFNQGARELVQLEWFAPGIKKTEARYLMAREITEVTADWWNGIYRIKVTGTDGKDYRHGSWSTWHRNGQLAGQGEYRFDRPEGKFTFWHENGQKSSEGNYSEGAQTGRWTWWHENGQKAIVGEFDDGEQIGSWSWWKPDGKLTESAVYSDPIVSSKEKGTAERQLALPHLAKEPTPAPPNPKQTVATPAKEPTPPSEATVGKTTPQDIKTREAGPVRQAVKPSPKLK